MREAVTDLPGDLSGTAICDSASNTFLQMRSSPWTSSLEAISEPLCRRIFLLAMALFPLSFLHQNAGSGGHNALPKAAMFVRRIRTEW